MKLSVTDKLGAARTFALKRCPYSRAALYALVPTVCEGLGTMAVTDSMLLLYDPAVVDKWSVEELAAVMVGHEIWHVLRMHAKRRGDKNPKLWNMAGDAEINDDAIAGGWKFPGNPVTPKLIGEKDGLTAEEYYRALEKLAQQAMAEAGEEGEEGEAGDGSGEGEGEGGGEGEGDSEDDAPGKEGGGEGKGKKPQDKPDAAGGWCGSCAGRPVPQEPKDAKAKKEAGGRTEAEIGRIRERVAGDIRDHVAQKGVGSIPLGLSRWSDEVLKPPTVRWQEKLQRLLRRSLAMQAGKVDTTYNRPSRRQAGVGYGSGRPVLPSFHAPQPEVDIWLDTSGSMGEAELAEAMSETQGILKAVGARARFGACDAEVHSLKHVRTVKEAVALVKGGGGTSFIPIFREIEKARPRPNIAIVFTDGQGPAPAEPPKGTAVIWCLIGPYQQRPCSWGEFIEIKPEPKK